MSVLVPLPIYPWPQDDDTLQRIRVAFEKIGAPFPVQPVPANPGEPGRILGIEAFPPYVCDLAYVPDRNDQATLDDRVRWLLMAPPGHRAGFLISDYLSSILGAGVKEVVDDA